MARILVIDDEASIRDMLRLALEEAGHEVTLAVDGAAGLRQVRQTLPDLVVTDLIMPEKEGIETILELRRVTSAHLPIVAISGGGKGGQREYLEVARKLGADRTLSKPFKIAHLLAVIQELLDQGDGPPPAHR